MKRLAILDISSFIFRAFYAIRPLTAPNEEKTPVNAVYGVLSMMLKVMGSVGASHMILARDSKGPTFRHEMYDLYKANRSAPPDELIPQFALIEQLMGEMNLPTIQQKGMEADDLIGSLVTQWKDDFDEILILTGDKDLMQFVGGNVFLLDTMKDKRYDRDAVFEKMGVWPEQVVDYLSILGDTSDNIPGVKGVGQKGASKLLAEYQTLEKVLEVAPDLKNKRAREGLVNYRDSALLSKSLIQIKTDIKLAMYPEETLYTFTPEQSLFDFLKSLGFHSFVKKISDMSEAASPAPVQEESHFIVDVESVEVPALSEVSTADALKKLESLDNVAIFTDFSGEMPNKSLTRVYFSDGKESFYVSSPDNDFVFSFLNFKKIYFLFQAKEFLSFLDLNNLNYIAKLPDVGLLDFVITPDGRHTFEAIIERYMNITPSFEGEQTSLFEDNHSSFASKVFYLNRVGELLMRRVDLSSLKKTFWDLDYPMSDIVARMENEGIIVDSSELSKIQKDFRSELVEIENMIKTTVETALGSPFDVNLKSPKQVGDLLFNQLKLPVIKMLKTGPSTSADVLSVLATDCDSPIPALILRYRELEKLLSTYVEPLPLLINPVTKRIHTSFNLDGAATGRLSSSNPNLQNIPVRSKYGQKIRKAFMAKEGCELLSFDYSQIELRILAHLSKDPVMLEAFNNGRDIHTETAAEVGDIDISQVTKEDRSMAKAVNFGLMYGQSSFGLSKQLKISRGEAAEYIDRYFEKFSSVKIFLDELREKAEEKTYAETIFGRIRPLPDIRSTNRNVKAHAERMAINSPIQGSAADMLKIAMIEIDAELKKRGLLSKMILQVHDEVILESPVSEVEEVTQVVKESMEGVLKVDVPFIVGVSRGANWFELK